MLGVTLLSALVALPAAWLLERTDLPHQHTLRRWLTLPYAIPSFLNAIAWIVLANPNVGWMKLISEQYLGYDLSLNIYSMGGMIFVETSCLFSILLLTFAAGLRKMDPSLEEAARMSGAGPWRSFFSITMPLMKGPLLAGFLSVSTATVASFGVPAMIGGPARRFVLTTGIFSLLKEGSSTAMNQALSIAAAISVFALLSSWMISRSLRSSSALISGKSARPSRQKLGPWGFWAAGFLWFLIGIFFILPALTLLASSFQLDTSQFNAAAFGTRSWRYVFFELTEFKRAFFNSWILAVVAAGSIVLLALLVTVEGRRTRLRALFETLSLALYSLPGTAMALLLIVAVSAFPGGHFLMNGLGILLLAYTLKYFSLGIRTVGSSVDLVHPSLIEAAQLSGASRFQILLRIWFPLIKTALGAAFILCLLPCLAELTMTALLYGPGTENLGVLIFQLQEYADRTSAAVIGSLILIAILGLQKLSAHTSLEENV